MSSLLFSQKQQKLQPLLLNRNQTGSCRKFQFYGGKYIAMTYKKRQQEGLQWTVPECAFEKRDFSTLLLTKTTTDATTITQHQPNRFLSKIATLWWQVYCYDV